MKETVVTVARFFVTDSKQWVIIIQGSLKKITKRVKPEKAESTETQ